MIQELFGGGASFLGGGGDQRKLSFGGIVLEGSPSPSPSLSTSSTNTTPTTSTATTTPNTTNPPPPPDQQNLRCPRCDSSNTKFCYYNNYNLTQPRHFCKTCRRYWTKGGALRNVPIGGGCRKNKTTTTSATSAVKTTPPKIKTMSAEFGKSNFGFDLEAPSSNPILWTSPQSSQLMALLRATQNQNPNPNFVNIKEEGQMIGSYNRTSSDSSLGTSSALNARALGGVVDPLSQVPLGLCNPFWRNNQHQTHQNQNHNTNNMFMGDVQSSGIQELFQRLRSTGNYYSDNHSASQFNNNVGSTSSSSSTLMEPSPITAAEVGYWNHPSFSWSNLPATNGAFQ